MKVLETIPFPGFATTKDWKGYPKGCMAHPARNRPPAVRWLIDRYTKLAQKVWDPMLGVGTMPIEAHVLGRVGLGWDIDPHWRKAKDKRVILLETPDPGSIDLVITSPPFFGTNHPPGNTAAQEKYSKQIQSTAGTAYKEAHIPGHLGQLKDNQEAAFWQGLLQIYKDCFEALKPGGKLVTIVRDKIRKGKVYPFVSWNAKLLEKVGLTVLGAHPREIPKSARWQQRERLKPGQPFIGVEMAVVAVKPRS